MSGDRKIARYVEARIAAEALKQASLDEPAKRQSLTWLAAFTAASVEVSTSMAHLTGGELGRAQRILAQRGIGNIRLVRPAAETR